MNRKFEVNINAFGAKAFAYFSIVLAGLLLVGACAPSTDSETAESEPAANEEAAAATDTAPENAAAEEQATLEPAETTTSPEEGYPFAYDFEEIAQNVWVAIRRDSHRHPVMGNTTFVVGDNAVVVFDGGGLAIMADQIIDKIRSLTSAPVTHVVISHWHGDHNFGIYRFAEEWDNVEFVTHSFTDRALKSTRMNYLNNYPNYAERVVPRFEEALREGALDGEELSDADLREYQRMYDFSPVVSREYLRARLTQATIAFDEKFEIDGAGQPIELLYLGHGNTEGDIVMWLPETRIVATGDLVVHPTPYAFNVPPRAWAETLTRLNGLGYSQLVPGHGAVQTDTAYVDLNIEAATSIADQRDRLVSEGTPTEEIAAALDFSAFEMRFTGGDAYLKVFYDAYFQNPLRAAAVKELSGEPMAVLEPVEQEPSAEE